MNRSRDIADRTTMRICHVVATLDPDYGGVPAVAVNVARDDYVASGICSR